MRLLHDFSNRPLGVYTAVVCQSLDSFVFKCSSVTGFGYLKVYININFIYSILVYCENSILIYYEVINSRALTCTTSKREANVTIFLDPRVNIGERCSGDIAIQCILQFLNDKLPIYI